MQTSQTLIDKASTLCGGLRRLADRIDENASYLSQVRNGKKPISPGVAARIAEVAGLDARVVALQALVSQEKDHAKAIALARALGVKEPTESQSPPGSLLQQIPSKLRDVTNAARRLFKRSAYAAVPMLPRRGS